MLYLIGLGLRPEHLTLEALNALKECSAAYLDRYTSDYAQGSVDEVEKMAGKQLFQANRKDLEDRASDLVSRAKKEDVALCVFGDVFFATTHDQLLEECKKLGVKYKIIHGISFNNFLGDFGLSLYKFGGSATIVRPREQYAPESFYEKMLENQRKGLHTLCLLDNASGEENAMRIPEAIKVLQSIEKKRGEKLLNKSVWLGLSGIGSDQQQAMVGSAAELTSFPWKGKLHSMVLCGKLSDMERELLKIWKK